MYTNEKLIDFNINHGAAFDVVIYFEKEDKYKQHNNVHIQMNYKTEENITTAKDLSSLSYKC